MIQLESATAVLPLPLDKRISRPSRVILAMAHMYRMGLSSTGRRFCDSVQKSRAVGYRTLRLDDSNRDDEVVDTDETCPLCGNPTIDARLFPQTGGRQARLGHGHKYRRSVVPVAATQRQRNQLQRIPLSDEQ